MRILILFLIALVVASCSSGTSSQPTETTDTTVVSVEQAKWNVEYYVDDFNEKTDQAFVYSSFEGTFSNSATTNSDLTAFVLVDSVMVSFKLLEYGSHLVKNDELYKLKYKTDDGTIGELSLFNSYEGALRPSTLVKSDKEDYLQFRALLMSSKSVKFALERTRYNSHYNFEMVTDGLKDAMRQASIPE